MGVYRVYELPFSKVPYKHVYLRRGAVSVQRAGERSQENVVNDTKLEANISRARRNAIDIALSNKFEYFTTNEFRGDTYDRYDVLTCQKKIAKFFNNFKTRHAPDFIYLQVPEYHPKTGAVHMHGMIGGIPEGELYMPDTIPWRDKATGEIRQIKNDRGVIRWDRYQKSIGFFDCSRIRNQEQVAYYLSKYMSKDLIALPKGVRTFISSSGLNRPKLVIDTPSDGADFNASFENEWCKIKYDMCGDTLDLADGLGNINPFTGEIVEPDNMSDSEFFLAMRERFAADCGSVGEQYSDESEIPYENISLFE